MKQHFAALVVVLLGAACLLSGACSQSSNQARINATLSRPGDYSAPDLEQALDDTYKSMFGLMAPLYLFYAQNERWPADGPELLGLARQLGLTFDLSRFSQLDLSELQDGSLQVRFKLAPPDQGGGEFVLARPEFQDDDEDIVTIQKMMT